MKLGDGTRARALCIDMGMSSGYEPLYVVFNQIEHFIIRFVDIVDDKVHLTLLKNGRFRKNIVRTCEWMRQVFPFEFYKFIRASGLLDCPLFTKERKIQNRRAARHLPHLRNSEKDFVVFAFDADGRYLTP